jgi:hypothetical protein
MRMSLLGNGTIRGRPRSLREACTTLVIHSKNGKVENGLSGDGNGCMRISLEFQMILEAPHPSFTTSKSARALQAIEYVS